MSDASKNLSEIYDDIDLCYKVLGLTFSDPPDRVDKVYNNLVAEYTKGMQAGDPGGRQSAKDNLEQVKDLYERITSSLIYKDYAREYEKYKALKESQMLEKKHKAEAEKSSMVSCPHCSKLISPSLKTCIYCHHKILSPMEIMISRLFCTKNIVVVGVIVLLVVVGVVLLRYPQLLKV